MNLLLIGQSAAQQTEYDEQGPQDVDEIVVTESQQDGYKTDRTTLSKLTESLRETPQSITVLSRELMDDRGITDLNDALRTVTGITLGAGEFSWQGNNPSIRGFAEGWQISAGYTYLDSEVVESNAGSAPVGGRLPNAPEHSLSLWYTYQYSDRLQIGFGSQYLSNRLAQNVPPIKQVSSYWAFEAMGSYRVTDSASLTLNLTNLTNEHYFDQLHPWHVVPGPEFTAVLSLRVTL